MGKVTWLSACKEYCVRNGNWIVPKRDTPEYEAIHAIYRELVEAKARDPLSPCEDDTPDVKAVRQQIQLREQTSHLSMIRDSLKPKEPGDSEILVGKRGRKRKSIKPTRISGDYLISFT
jgi:hypothetical protein